MSKNKERKYTQISSVGAAVPNGTYGCLRTMSKKTGNLGCFVCPLPVFFFAQLPTIFGNITIISFLFFNRKKEKQKKIAAASAVEP